MGKRDLYLLLIIFFIGMLFHIYGYVLNDYADIEIDKKSSELKKKPLVSGTISKKSALLIIFLAVLLAYILTLMYFPYLFALLFLSIAILLGTIYDFFGKKIPGFSDLIIAGSLTFSFLFGASTVSISFTNLIYVLCLLIFFGIVFINVVEGGLKDVDHDHLTGGKTVAIITGVNVIEGKLVLTKKFKTLTYITFATCLLLIFFLGLQPEIDFWRSSYINLIIACPFLILVIVGLYRLLHMSVFKRSKIKRIYAVINGGAGALILIMLFPLLGLEITLFLVLLPFLWYVIFSFILYGKPLQPDV